MKVIDHIKKRKRKTLFSFEILPPVRGKGIDALYKGIDPLLKYDPAFINVTYHRDETVYKQHGENLQEKVAFKRRPGTVGICAAIQNRYNIDAVPHLICGGFTREETENALIDLQFLEIDNVLALRGDPLKTERGFKPTPGGNRYATDLIRQIKNLNEGKYLHEEDKTSSPTDFCIGCAGYPEKHFEALSLKTDMHYVKEKVDAGAEYVTTQLFFDNQKFFEFVKLCREAGIKVPIIPGIKPITKLRHISFLPKTFFVDFPNKLADALMNCKTDAQVKKVGLDWGVKQVAELIEFGVPSIHFYTMGRSDSVKTIAEELFKS